jgi:hypothetical protein
VNFLGKDIKVQLEILLISDKEFMGPNFKIQHLDSYC